LQKTGNIYLSPQIKLWLLIVFVINANSTKKCAEFTTDDANFNLTWYAGNCRAMMAQWSEYSNTDTLRIILDGPVQHGGRRWNQNPRRLRCNPF
jgi:hypothetical protein